MSAWINCNWFKKCQTKLRDKWDWGKYLPSIQHSIELLSIIYKKFLHIEKKKTSNSKCIWISNLQNRKSKEEKEKTWAASLVVSEIQIKRTPHHYSHIGMANITQSKLLQPFRRQSIIILNRPISYLGLNPSEIKVPGHLDTHIRMFIETGMALAIFLKKSLNVINRGTWINSIHPKHRATSKIKELEQY